MRQQADRHHDGRGTDVPINSAPVDQAAFTRLMLVEIAPKSDRETGVQYTTKDGMEKKWTAQVVASMPSRFDSTRTDSEVLSVTVTCADDPVGKVSEGDQVWFDGLTVGVMPPEQAESGRIRGGKLFWQAAGIQSRTAGSAKS
jgi:hypothetical protein